MSDLKRKYDGLKQAHKELSVEVVGLREKVVELEKDDTRKWDMMNADGVTLDRYKTALEEIALVPCICEPCYKDRGLIQPDCFYCHVGIIATEALKEADNG